MTLRDALRKALGKAEEEEYGSTYETLQEAANWEHFGVGRKTLIPSLLTGGIANALYSVAMFSVAMRAGRLLAKWGPWILAGTFACTACWVYWVRSRWDGTLVHRIALWWSGAPKIILGDFLLSEDESQLEQFAEVHAAAARFASEALPPKIPTVSLKPARPEEEAPLEEITGPAALEMGLNRLDRGRPEREAW